MDHGFPVIGLVRQIREPATTMGVRLIEMGDLQNADWMDLLKGVNSVVHLAGRVHFMKDTASDPLEAYRAVNVTPTHALGTAAAALGLERVVYVSSIKVNGEGPTTIPYRATDTPAPVGEYGVSKLEAERALSKALSNTGTTFTVLRPALVFGPGVGGNFLRLLRLVERGVPLPLANVSNRRSLMYVANLADLVVHCLTRDEAAGRTLLASDGEDLSTPVLIRAIAQYLGRPVRLFPFPVQLLRAAGILAGQQAVFQRICSSLTVDSEPTQRRLGWRPPWSVHEGLDATVQWYTHRRPARP